MPINYGRIQKYDTAKGFGFVKHRLGASQEDRIFFHIEEIRHKHTELAYKIEKKRFSPEIHFWYSTESTENGEQINDVWLWADELPLQAQEEVIEYIVKFWLNNVTITLCILEERDRLFLERDPRIQEQKEAEKKQRRGQLEEAQRREIQETSQRVEAKRQRLEAERQQRLEAEQERIRVTLDELINLAQLPNTDELIRKIKFGLSSIPVEVQDRFWSHIASKITYGIPLYKIAPSDIRMDIVRNEFNDFLDCLEKCISLPDFQIHWRSESVYSCLEEQDRELAREWLKGQSLLSEEQRPSVEAKMLSARAAERVAYFFFDALEQCPKDISITQLRHGSEEWKSHDLLLKNDIHIDVKNSRPSRNQRAYYVEHCVPQFKYTSNRNDILIAGVLSPYIRLDEIENPKSIKSNTEPITFLGITSRSIITRLEKSFVTDQLQSITLEKKNISSKKKISDHMKPYVIPSWIFDYPNKFYEKQNIYRERLTQITRYPSWNELRELGINPLPSIIATGLPIPLAWQKFLPHWQIDFCANMIRFKKGRFSLPQLYLNILSHFLKMLSLSKNSRRDSNYQPLTYMTLLYFDSTPIKAPTTFYDEDEMAQKKPKENSPLGIADPLNIIKNLIISLQTIWEYMVSDRRDLSEFQSFSFRGLGLLIGNPKNSSYAQKTILAYCGGKVGGVTCGNTPLVIGRHKTCSECGYLICDKCGFCSENCKPR